MNEKTQLEPGFLPTFRLLAWVLAGISTFQTISIIVRLGWDDGLITNPVWIIPYGNLLVLGLLYWPWVRKRTGKFFVPLLVVIASAGGILRTYLAAMIRFNPEVTISILVEGGRNLTIPFEFFEFSLILSSWQLIPLLFIPLIMVAWQYNFKSVILFVIGSTVFDIAMFLTIVSDSEIFLSLLSVSGVLITRILTFLVAGFLVCRMMAAQHKQRLALRQANQQLLGYTMTLEQLTTSRERNRLARELHDTLAHTLSGLAVQLGAIKALWDKQEDQARLKLEEAITATRSGLNETRRALQALRAEPLEDLGLSLALRELAQSAAARSGAHLALDLPEKALEIPPNLSQAFYRTAQEALENTVRYARTEQIRVSLKQDRNELTLIVADDGIGFDPAASAQDTYGLRGLRERADLIGGELRIDSEPGKGTTIKLTAEMRHGK